jgi:tetratricopeptide (TPR) repeat protein
LKEDKSNIEEKLLEAMKTFDIKKEDLLEQAQTLLEKGWDENDKKSYNSALDYFSQCLQIQIEAVGKGGRETANTLDQIGWTYYWQRNYAKAIEY